MKKSRIHTKNSGLNESVNLEQIMVDRERQFVVSFEHNSAIPTSLRPNFLYDILEEEMLDVVRECNNLFEQFSDFYYDFFKGASILSKLIRKCSAIEKQSRDKLEKICLNLLIEHFHIPEDSVDIEVNLVDSMLADDFINRQKINFKPVDNYVYDDEHSIIELNSEIDKRNVLKYFSVGYAIKKAYSLLDSLVDYGISEDLIVLYKKIMMLNQFLLFNNDIQSKIESAQHGEYLLGINYLDLGKPDEKAKITAQGVTFPSLLVEGIKGFMDLFSSHGLPKDIEKANAVLSMTDTVLQEPFDMKVGPALLDKIWVDIDMKYMPYFFMRMSKLNCYDFSWYMRELLCGTKVGKQIFQNILKKSVSDFEEAEVENGVLPTMQTDKNIITDEYIHPDEL